MHPDTRPKWPPFFAQNQPRLLQKPSPPFAQITPALKPTLHQEKIWALISFAYGILIKHISNPTLATSWHLPKSNPTFDQI